jgi:hypothetical protein
MENNSSLNFYQWRIQGATSHTAALVGIVPGELK